MKKNFQKLYLIILILVPIFLFLLTANFFDTGESICVSVVFFEKECFACGMTRAIQHLIHFDFSIAFEYNKLSIFILPLLLLSYYNEVKRIFKFIRSS